jgi:hypothetical protein
VITIGEVNPNLDAIDGGNGHELIAQAATLAQPAVIQSMSIYVTTPAGTMQLGIYDALGTRGRPRNLKARTASFAPVAGWNTVKVVTPVLLPAANYWLAFLPADGNLENPKQYGSG